MVKVTVAVLRELRLKLQQGTGYRPGAAFTHENSVKGARASQARRLAILQGEQEAMRRLVLSQPGIASLDLFMAYNNDRAKRGLPPLRYSRFWVILQSCQFYSYRSGTGARGGWTRRWMAPVVSFNPQPEPVAVVA